MTCGYRTRADSQGYDCGLLRNHIRKLSLSVSVPPPRFSEESEVDMQVEFERGSGSRFDRCNRNGDRTVRMVAICE